MEGGKDIGIIGLTGQMHGIVYLDEKGDVISPLYTWQDQRGNLPVFEGKTICTVAEEMTEVKAASGYGLLTHLYNTRQNLVSENAKQICTIMDYMGMKLTGRKKPLVHSSNAASFGFYDVCAGVFREKELEMLQIFQELYDAEYEMQSVRLIDDYWVNDDASLSDDLSVEQNNTSAF